jgi:hypothetical protein
LIVGLHARADEFGLGAAVFEVVLDQFVIVAWQAIHSHVSYADGEPFGAALVHLTNASVVVVLRIGDKSLELRQELGCIVEDPALGVAGVEVSDHQRILPSPVDWRVNCPEFI